MPEDKVEKRFYTEKDIEEFVVRQLSRSFVYENMVGTVNSSNVKFNTSTPFTFLIVFIDGVVNTAYTVLSQTSIAFNVAPTTNSIVSVFYVRG